MKDKSQKISDRIYQVKWSKYQTAYGNAEVVADQLITLAGNDKKEAMDASHDLWCGLCHQHAYVSSAALPSYPFLKEVLLEADEDLVAEILDILLGFATCTRPDWPDNATNDEEWQLALRSAMLDDLPVFKRLAQDGNEAVRDIAEGICDELELKEIVVYEGRQDWHVDELPFEDIKVFEKPKSLLARAISFIGIR